MKTNLRPRARARLLVAPLLFAICLVSASCDRAQKSSDDDDSAVASSAPRPVRVFTTPVGSDIETRTYPVFIKGGDSVKLSFRTAGRIVDFDATVGARFKEGDVVARLDVRDYQLAVDRIEKSIAEARAGLSAMKTGARAEDVASLEAALEAANSQLSTADKQLSRIESLYKDGVASESQYDLAKSTREGALAAKTAAEKNLEKARVGARSEEIEMLEAKIAGLEVELELARNKLADTELHAPFDGVVSEKYSDNHESVLPGAPIITLVNDATLEGELNVSEEFIARQASLVSVECSFDELPNRVFPARIKQTSTSTQQGSRSYPVTLVVDAQPNDGLLVGMIGEATFQFKDARAYVTIPTSALVAGEVSEDSDDSSTKNFSVWIVDEETQTARRRDVKVGVFTDEQAQILEGLEGGEPIVSAGARFLVEGQRVKP